jgi:DedD protein
VKSSYDSDTDLHELHESASQDREISLGTSTILGIFFALVLICAAFFGFGYTLGRRSAQPTVVAAQITADPDTVATSKPAPGSAAAARALLPQQTRDTEPAPSSSDPDAPTSSTAQTAVATPPALSVVTRPETKPAIKPVTLAQTSASPSVQAIVQVAAVSHPEDAEVLVKALKQRGYTVNIRQEQQDKLLHVQLGPFATKKDAEAMRQRLLADGYNAIVK